MGRSDLKGKDRRRIIRRSWVKCRSCGTRAGVRYCPGVNNYICPACCEKMRPNLSACSSCKYYLYTLARSRELPETEPKFYTAIASDSEKAGLVSLAVAFEKPDGRLKTMFFLLDFWKSGMKECFVDVDITKEEFNRRISIIAGHEPKKISIDDAKKLIQRALYISNAISAPIPWDYLRWKHLLGDMSDIPLPTGSIYKCARCGADLPDSIVSLIKEHAQSEDVHFYMVCEKCAGEFED